MQATKLSSPVANQPKSLLGSLFLALHIAPPLWPISGFLGLITGVLEITAKLQQWEMACRLLMQLKSTGKELEQCISAAKSEEQHLQLLADRK
jgi:hypothetical protein